MRIYLDDIRKCPKDWILARWPEDVINLLKTNLVEEISLDHDLGNDYKGTGYDVLLWIENEVAFSTFIPPLIHIHTSNPAAKKRMLKAVESIKAIYERKQKK